MKIVQITKLKHFNMRLFGTAVQYCCTLAVKPHLNVLNTLARFTTGNNSCKRAKKGRKKNFYHNSET